MRRRSSTASMPLASASIQGRSSSAKAVSRVWWFWFSTPQWLRTSSIHWAVVSRFGSRLDTYIRSYRSTTMPCRTFRYSTSRKALACGQSDSCGFLPSP